MTLKEAFEKSPYRLVTYNNKTGSTIYDMLDEYKIVSYINRGIFSTKELKSNKWTVCKNKEYRNVYRRRVQTILAVKYLKELGIL